MVTDQSAPQAEGIWIYREQHEDGGPTGRTAVFEGEELQPLGYSDLVSLKLNAPCTLRLRWARARVVESSIPEIAAMERANVATTLETPFTNVTIGLIRGGWLPSGLALRNNMTLLPDRCTISDLAERYRRGQKLRRGDDFLDLFQGKPVRINPGLFAIEGNTRQLPSADQVAEQWAEASRKIRTALPEAQLVADSAVHGLVGLLGSMRESMERRIQFLCEVVPMLLSPVSTARRQHVVDKVLELAQQYGLPKHTLVVLAALSTVSVKNGAGPAKRLIKPSATYCAKDAHNALADLRSLELLICLYSLFPGENIMLCTGDKNLALFWAGLRASGFALGIDGSVNYTLSPIEALLPHAVPGLLG